MTEYLGAEVLRRKLTEKQPRTRQRYSCYEMKNTARDFGISTPPNMRLWQAVLGWCAKAVDALADRLIFRDFANDNFGVMDIYRQNNPDILFDSAILSALIGACSFLYIREDEDGTPRFQVIDGRWATGVIDQTTGLLTEGYAVLERDNNNRPLLEGYFLPGVTYYVYADGRSLTYTHAAPAPLLVPVIYRPDAARPFGHSRISRACMQLTEEALRTIKRSEISAEFYSYPQRYVLGLSSETADIDAWKASMSAMFRADRDDDGNLPTVGQFAQQSMSPHVEQLRMFASLFAGETGLTLDDLGFATENPSSADAIKASHENLRLTARKAQRTFGSGFLNAGFLAACLRDGQSYKREALALTTPKWEPIFEPDASMLSVIGDGALKINQAVPGYFGTGNLRDMTGVEPED